MISSSWTTAANPTFHTFMKILLSKQVSIFGSLTKLFKDDTGSTLCWHSMKDVQHRIRSAVGLVLKNCKKNVLKQTSTDNDAEGDVIDRTTFLLVLKCCLHPVACTDRDSLRKMTDLLQSLFGRERYYGLYLKHHAFLVDLFVVQRTGILSADEEVRRLASNVLIAMAWSGHLDKFIKPMSKIFNY